MRKLLVLLGVACVAAGISASSAGAITGAEPDGTRHPAAGAIVGYFPPLAMNIAYCSGVLISPTVFLTAAHCGAVPTLQVGVTFDEHYSATSTVYMGTFIAHPDYRRGSYPASPKVPDIGVVVFDEPIPGIVPAQLPTAGLLDQMKAARTLASTRFTAVGYGDTEYVNGPGGHDNDHPQARHYAVSTFSSLSSARLHLSQHLKKGEGGTCAGDSGGPNFIGAGADETSIVAGITVTGDTYCKATNVILRLDTQPVRDFLDDYVTLP